MPITHLNYDINESRMIDIFEQNRSRSETYHDSRYNIEVLHWKILKLSPEFFEQIFEDLGVRGSPRFYYLPKHSVIPVHVDNGTRCSVNFILGDRQPAPITIAGQDYFYTQAVLNTQVPHGVKNMEKDRLLFKISIFDFDYYQTVDRIRCKK